MSGRAWCWAWRPGGAVRGVAYRVAAAEWVGKSHAYLREREQPTEDLFRGRGPN